MNQHNDGIETRVRELEREVTIHTHPESQLVFRMDERGQAIEHAVRRIELEMATKGEVAALRLVVDTLLTKVEFAPYKLIVGGLVVAILLAFIGGLTALVFTRAVPGIIK